MAWGGGIFLIVIGAILAFAVEDRISGIDLTAIGWICIAAGALGILLGLAFSQRATGRTEVVERRDIDPL